MTFRDRLVKAVKEAVESSKEMIDTNVTDMDSMGMANVAPGEFAQEEITDKNNLVNQGSMSNDTDFNRTFTSTVFFIEISII